MMNLYFRRLILHCALAMLVSCSEVTNPMSGDGSITPTDANSPIILEVSSSWYSQPDSNETHQTCSISSSATIGSETICTATIPEAQLHWSNIKITATLPSETCSLFSFKPYYYTASRSAGFIPLWRGGTETIDCSDTLPAFSDFPVSPNCYNGPIKEIMSGIFPERTGLVYIADTGFKQTWSITAPGTITYNTNRYITNNATAAQRASTIDLGTNDDYLANSMQDYSFICFDSYGEIKYQMTLYITDQDSSTENYCSWTSALPFTSCNFP